MESILPTNEYTEVEGRAYLNPQIALDESNTFIDNLRATQGQQTEKIASDTHMLGTDVPSNLGGLIGAGSYFTSRYQTPQTNSAVANLRATAQAAALNQALSNEQEMWKKRYNDAYRAYQKRANNGNGGGSGGDGGSGDGGGNGEDGDTEFVTSYTIDGVVPGVEGGYTVGNILPDWDNPENSVVTGITGVPYGEDHKTNYVYNYSPTYSSYIGTGANITRNFKDDSGHWKLEYSLPGGGTAYTGFREELVKGSDGNYYVHNKDNNEYTYVGR